MSTPNSRPGSRRSSNASSSHGRPVPVLPPDIPAANDNTENGANEQPVSCTLNYLTIVSSIFFNINTRSINFSLSFIHALHVQLDEDSDGDTRLHHPSSNSRTQFTAQTPAAEKAAIQSLRTKMSFSDHSVSSQGKRYMYMLMYVILCFWKGIFPKIKPPENLPLSCLSTARAHLYMLSLLVLNMGYGWVL